jgi:hypothetical protein
MFTSVKIKDLTVVDKVEQSKWLSGNTVGASSIWMDRKKYHPL